MREFRLLGPLEVANDQGALPLGGQKQRALLALLLLDVGRVVSVDRLVDALWGEQPPRTAQTSLHNLIAQLRKLLGPDAIATQAPGYVLRVDPSEIDLHRFERLVEQARAAEGEPKARLFREALALWRGTPLAELAFEPFAQEEIARLEELRLATLEERIDADLAVGRHAELVGDLESLVSAHPLRERARAQLMLDSDRRRLRSVRAGQGHARVRLHLRGRREPNEPRNSRGGAEELATPRERRVV